MAQQELGLIETRGMVALVEATDAALKAAKGLLASAFEGGFYTGVDLAVQRHSSADETVLFTLFLRPDGKRQVVEVLAGKWTGR